MEEEDVWRNGKALLHIIFYVFISLLQTIIFFLAKEACRPQGPAAKRRGARFASYYSRSQVQWK